MSLPSWWKPAAGIIAVLALAWYVNGCYEDRYQQQVGAAEAQAERADERAASAMEALDIYAGMVAVLEDSTAVLEDSLAESRSREAIAEREAEEAGTRRAEAGEDVDATVDSLRAVVRPEVRPVVDTLESQIGTERVAVEERDDARLAQIMELEAQVVTTERQRDIERAGRIQAENVARTLRVALEERTAEAERWREAAEPGFFEGFVDSFSQVGTTAVVVGVALLAL